MKSFGKIYLTKTCDVCRKKGIAYKVYLPNWQEFIFACPACTRDFDDAEEFADAYELGNLALVK